MQGFEERRSGPDFANVTHLEETTEIKMYFKTFQCIYHPFPQLS